MRGVLEIASEDAVNAIKYRPTPVAAGSHFLLLLGALLLFLGRTESTLRFPALRTLLPDFYLHASNFCISYLLYAGVGFLWLLLGVPFRYLAGLGVLLALGNVAYEYWIPVLNTPDPTDAWYGMAGTALAFTVLRLLRRWGLRALPAGNNGL